MTTGRSSRRCDHRCPYSIGEPSGRTRPVAPPSVRSGSDHVGGVDHQHPHSIAPSPARRPRRSVAVLSSMTRLVSSSGTLRRSSPPSRSRTSARSCTQRSSGRCHRTRPGRHVVEAASVAQVAPLTEPPYTNSAGGPSPTTWTRTHSPDLVHGSDALTRSGRGGSASSRQVSTHDAGASRFMDDDGPGQRHVPRRTRPPRRRACAVGDASRVRLRGPSRSGVVSHSSFGGAFASPPTSW